jgi:hypothetical protein
MESVTTSAITIAIAVLTETLKVPAKKLGEFLLEKSSNLLKLLKNRSLGKENIVNLVDSNSFDYRKALHELEVLAKQDPEIAQSILDLENTIRSDSSESSKLILAIAAKLEENANDSQPFVNQNFGTIAHQYLPNANVTIHNQVVNM